MPPDRIIPESRCCRFTRQILEQEFQKARAAGERVIVMVHGGDEYEHRVNDEQRRWARWLVARGASLIVGAHPHVIQREEIHGGAVILHSLGNAVYPKDLKGADSGQVTVNGDRRELMVSRTACEKLIPAINQIARRVPAIFHPCPGNP